MSKAAEQHDENALKEECASLRSWSPRGGKPAKDPGVQENESYLESQVAHVHGGMRDAYNLAMGQLNIKASRLSELEAMAYDYNSESQQLRAENSESASLRKAIKATNEYQSMINTGTD